MGVPISGPRAEVEYSYKDARPTEAEELRGSKMLKMRMMQNLKPELSVKFIDVQGLQ